jgi:hypothetical protein
VNDIKGEFEFSGHKYASVEVSLMNDTEKELGQS